MKKLFITTILLASFAFTGNLFAQSQNLTDAWFALKNNDLPRAKQSVDEAYVHETTKGTAKMYYYRGLVYMQIAANAQDDPKYVALDSEASIKSAESFYQYLISSEKKKKSDIEDVYSNMLYSANFCLIDAGKLADKGLYKLAVKYAEAAYNLTLHDERQNLKQNGITTNKTLLSMYYYANEAGDKVNSRKYLNMLIENKYDEPQLYIFLANSYFAESDSANGIATLEKGREIYPENKELLIEEINYYLAQGKTEELLVRFNQAIESDPENSNYYFYRGTLYHQKKDYALAEADYKKAIELNDNNMDAKYNLGAMYIEQTVPIIEKMNANASNFALYDDLEIKKFALYEKALPFLKEAYESGDIKDKQEKLNLLTILRDFYKFKKDRTNMIYYQDEIDKVTAGK
ncbi:MAG: tetratricopeptide repeat protein [Bacteroidetes bacterium]|nr:tetratricopeptide repeat protein [Bacteroidota bacterium]